MKPAFEEGVLHTCDAITQAAVSQKKDSVSDKNYLACHHEAASLGSASRAACSLTPQCFRYHHFLASRLLFTDGALA